MTARDHAEAAGGSGRIQCRPVGFIRSAFTDVQGMPIQTAAAQDVIAYLDVLPEFQKGLSIINLISVDGLTLSFRGCDMLDGTPVLNIKPYVPAFDIRAAERVGWYEQRIQNLPHTRSDDRMSR